MTDEEWLLREQETLKSGEVDLYYLADLYNELSSVVEQHPELADKVWETLHLGMQKKENDEYSLPWAEIALSSILKICPDETLSFIIKIDNDRDPLRKMIKQSDVLEYVSLNFKDENTAFCLAELAKGNFLKPENMVSLLNCFIVSDPTDSRIRQALKIATVSSRLQTRKNKQNLLQTIVQHTENQEIFDSSISALSKLKNENWYCLENAKLSSYEAKKIRMENNPEDRFAAEKTLREENYIETYLGKKYPELPFEEQLLKETVFAVGSGDDKKKEAFLDLLLSEGEARLSEIDEQIMKYLVNNLTQENLDAVNQMRGLYGIKVSLQFGEPEDTNITTVKRMQFDNMINKIYNDTYYNMLHSQEFLDFTADENQNFTIFDYIDFDEKSYAFQALEEYGYTNFENVAIDAFINHHVPPEIAVKFNLKDIHELVIDSNEYEYERYGDKEEGDDVYNYKDYFSLNELGTENGSLDARGAYWIEMVENKNLVEAMSRDLKNHGIDESEIKTFWKYADIGTPNKRKKWEPKNFIVELHHNKALKDGGKNTPNNFVPVIRYINDDHCERNFSAHDFLHRQDSPLIKLYENPDAKTPQDKIATTEPLTPNARRIRITNELISPDPHHRVLYYGGPRQSSCYRGILRNMTNIDKLTKDNVAKQKEKTKKTIDMPVKTIQAFMLKQMTTGK